MVWGGFLVLLQLVPHAWPRLGPRRGERHRQQQRDQERGDQDRNAARQGSPQATRLVRPCGRGGAIWDGRTPPVGRREAWG